MSAACHGFSTAATARRDCDTTMTRRERGGGTAGRQWTGLTGGRVTGEFLARRKATDPAARIGTMLYGPGGPGNSGVALIKQGETNRPGLL